jgi:hypothetical protein
VEKPVKENFPEVEQRHDAIAKTIGLGNWKHMSMTEIFRTMAVLALASGAVMRESLVEMFLARQSGDCFGVDDSERE